MDKQSPLLQTKSSFQLPRGAHVQRHRLIAHAAQLVDYRLAVVVAAPGSGKTTLLSQWQSALQDSGSQVGVILLHKACNDARQFMQYLIAALWSADSSQAHGATALLSSTPKLPVDALLSMLVNELGASEREVFLLLDDYQFIHASEVHAIVQSLLDDAPRNFHLVMASRTTPPLNLVQLKVRRQLFELPAAALRLTETELREFSRLIHGVELREDEAHTLREHTEGWLAGVHLVLLTLLASTNRKHFFEHLPGCTEDIGTYLMAEVFSRQSDETREFLLKTSILERFNEELCNLLLERNDSRAILDRLRAQHLFLISLDERQEWYRFHHLFASFLKTRCESEIGEQIPELHRKAFAWFCDSEDFAGATNHALHAGEYELLIEQIERRFESSFLVGRISQLFEHVDRLPVEVVRDRPKLLLAKVWMLVHTPHSREAGRLLIRVKRILEAEQPVEGVDTAGESHKLWSHVRVLTAGVLNGVDHPRMAGFVARRWQKSMPEGDALLSCVINNIIAHTEYALGHPLAARSAGATSWAALRDKPELIFARIYALMLRGLVENATGNLAAAHSAYEDAIAVAVEAFGRGSYPESLVAVCLAEVLYERNQLPEVEALLRQHRDIARNFGTIDHVNIAVVLGARLSVLRGETSAAMQTLNDADEVARTGFFRRMRSSLVNERVRILLAQQDSDAAGRLLQQLGLDPDRNEDTDFGKLRVSDSYRVLALARFWLHQGRTAPALRHLEALTDRVERCGHVRLLLEALLLQSLALHASRREIEALASLTRATALTQQEGFVRSYADEGNGIGALLRKLLEQERATASRERIEYLGLLIEVCSGAGDSAAPAVSAAGAADRLNALTERELDVARVLAQGKSNKEIAKLLDLTPGTVKWHLKNIFDKLHVRNRTEAVIFLRRAI